MIFINVDDIGKHILKPSLEGNFRGSKVVEQEKHNKKKCAYPRFL